MVEKTFKPKIYKCIKECNAPQGSIGTFLGACPTSKDAPASIYFCTDKRQINVTRLMGSLSEYFEAINQTN